MTIANHKVNKNVLIVKFFSGSSGYGDETYTTKNIYDNFYIENLIPRSEYQYSWVTASAASDGRADMSGYATSENWLDGYQTLSGSRIRQDGTDQMRQDNLGTNLWDRVSGMAQYERQATDFTFSSMIDDPPFNYIVLDEALGLQIGTMFLYSVNGPYGWPIWKQIRGSEGPVSKYLKRKSSYNVISPSRNFIDSNGKNIIEKINPNQETYYETMIDLSSRPLVHSVNQKIGVINNSQVISNPKFYQYDFSSKMSYFANEEMQNRYAPESQVPEEYSELLGSYKGSNVTDVSGFISIDYSHMIWPKFKNYNRSISRDLGDFQFNWEADRPSRNILPDGNDYYRYESIWPLDGRSSLTDPTYLGSTRIPQAALGNRYVLRTTSSTTNWGDTGRLNAVANFSHNGVFPSPSLPPFIKVSPSMTWMGSTDPNDEGMFWTGDTPFSIPEQTGFTPFADSYDDWADHPRSIGQGMSKIAEFRISEHVQDIVRDFDGNFLSDIDSFLTTTGSGDYISSADDGFYETYTTSEILKDFGKIREDHEGIAVPSRFELSAEAVMKFTPYEGFYPAERVVQLSTLFSQSYAPGMSYTSSLTDDSKYNTPGRNDTSISSDVKFRNLMTPYFSPGILLNSIKAGLAVDFPIITGSYRFPDTEVDDSYEVYGFAASNDWDVPSLTYANMHLAALGSIGEFGKSYFKRLSFESIIRPEAELAGYKILDMHTHLSSSLNITASIGPTDGIYSLAMSNYLAEVPSFFLEGSNVSSIISAPDDDQDKFIMTLGKTYKMRFIVRGCDDYDDGSIIQKAIEVGKVYNSENSFGMNTISTGSNVVGNNFIFANIGMAISQSYYGKNYQNYSRPYYDFGSFSGISGFGVLDFTSSYDHTYSGYGPNVGGGLSGVTVNGVDTLLLVSTGKIADNIYTPAYNNGYAYVDYEFKPYDENGNIENSSRKRRFSVNEIMSNITSSYYRAGKLMHRYIYNNSTSILGYSGKPDLTSQFQNTEVYYVTGSNSDMAMRQDMLHEMQLDSSFNLFDVVRNKSVEYDKNGNVLSLRDGSTAGDRMCIYPKWEVPIYDYSNASKSIPLSGSNNMSRGVWSDWGADLTGSQGLFMQVTDAPSQKWEGVSSHGPGIASLTEWYQATSDARTGSLADVMGIDKKAIRLGKTAQSKKVFEAIVAVPYLETGTGKKFIKIEKPLIDSVKDGTALDPKQSIVDLVKNMQKYVIPPKFNFYKYDGKDGMPVVDPVVMYFLEFEYEFDRDDMKKMWHNVSPKSIVKEATAAVGHELIPGELMGSIIDDSMKWMVFKVKQKAEWNYYKKTLSSKDDDKFRFDFTKTGKNVEPEYSYNWPYDYMSIIDRAKIKASVKIETNEAADNRRSRFDISKLTKVEDQSPIEIIRNYADKSRSDQFGRTTVPIAPVAPAPATTLTDDQIIDEFIVPQVVADPAVNRDLNPFKKTQQEEPVVGKVTSTTASKKIVSSVIANRTKKTKTKIR